MFAHERANRILAAWLSGDSTSMKREMERAVDQFDHSATRLEEEEQELLAGLCCDLLAAAKESHPASGDRVQSSFALLQHLSTRVRQAAIATNLAA
jgi:hypothetical protein